MANIKSAKKRTRRNARRADINGARRGRVRTYVKKVEAALADNDREAAEAALKEAQPELMRGVGKGILHRNTAARKIARLNARLKTLG
ncbi:MAG: 30S ribosomal protein S20 [Defluviicoccus sp.]|nr:30S ribosomal protein S20 [Defluviicoccus sp.]MDE0275814.1 30S ribosomal protein S20 [Defluviicoccus sp.]